MEHLLTREYLWSHALASVIRKEPSCTILLSGDTLPALGIQFSFLSTGFPRQRSPQARNFTFFSVTRCCEDLFPAPRSHAERGEVGSVTQCCEFDVDLRFLIETRSRDAASR